jgi:hypothetical protein
MIPQVIDAMGDKRDCQREHLSHKLTSLEKRLSDRVIARIFGTTLSLKIFNRRITQSPNFPKQIQLQQGIVVPKL